ncbi:hypothetical protein QBC37DRAFT_428479 [Rhypophila decipiens]|uniref:Heme haloperoxidase family profile domain-containing protein n=1 Tax=Rhypophila decipiens TaxID=261697 RepID=A0AAN6Y1R1_9PEZI|nr:hypothetical protein QBC37DRAFT_428479 [Rhypophila decipiens]
MASTSPPSPRNTDPQTRHPACTASFSNMLNNDEGNRPPPRGVYQPPEKTDTRGPCPMLNTLANHGLIPRSGRNIQAREITSALHDVVGVSWPVALLFTHPIFLVHGEPDGDAEKWWESWRGVRQRLLENPLNMLVFRWGMRESGQYVDVPDAKTNKMQRVKVINLDQMGTANAIEHDISLTRRDRGQTQGCMAKQVDLVDGLLGFKCPLPPGGSPSHGEDRDVEATAEAIPSAVPMLTLQDLAGYRRQRVTQQRAEAGGSSRMIKYGKMEHSFACMEIALFLGVFGLSEEKYNKVPRAHARAFFMEERLPLEEGWIGRGMRTAERGWRPWWKFKCLRRGNSHRLGWLELIRSSGKVRRAIGRI